MGKLHLQKLETSRARKHTRGKLVVVVRKDVFSHLLHLTIYPLCHYFSCGLGLLQNGAMSLSLFKNWHVDVQ